MKRPLCLLALMITALIYLYLELFVSDDLYDHSDTGDGEFLQIEGFVDSKEYRVDYLGEISPVIYIIPCKKDDLGKNKYIQCYMSNEDYVEPAIGQLVRVAGIKKTFEPGRNPGEFDSRLYYSTLKIAYRITKAQIKGMGGEIDIFREGLYRIKYRLESVLDSCLSNEDSAVMKGVILGDKAFMDEDTKRLYKNAGIIHIMAVSGLHISILGMGLHKIFRKIRIPLIPASVLPIAFMYIYGQMCGMSASSVRAIVMFGIRLLAPVLGRTYDLLSALSLAEIMLLIEQPLYLYNSGFLFSFGAILGVTIVAPGIKLKFFSDVLVRMGLLPENEKSGTGSYKMKFADEKVTERELVCEHVLNAFRSGIGIALATLPVYSMYYYTYPIHSLFLNLIVIPIVGILMIIGIITMSFGAVLVFWGAGDIHLLGLPVRMILLFYRFLCSSTVITRRMTWYMGYSGRLRVLGYIVIISLFIIASYQNKRYCKLLIGAAIITLTFHIGPQLNISMIDVGQGDGIVISSGGRNVLIDGGSTSKKNVGKYQIIPFLKYKGIGSLDAIVLTHEDEDHLSGIMDILDDMEKGGIYVKELILPEVDEKCRGENYRGLEDRAEGLKIPVFYINTGERFRIGKTEFLCINPELNMKVEGANAYSTVLFMKYGNFTALLTGDCEQEGQDNIKRVIHNNPDIFNNIDLLKVAHHGSKYTTDTEFLEMIKPRIALISCGEDNRYGHPHSEVLERLADIGTIIYRTDLSGEIEVNVLDGGERLKISEFIKYEDARNRH